MAWLGALMVCLLSGFGFTMYQLARLEHFRQLDEQLGQRVVVLSKALRGGGGKVDRGPGPPPSFEHELDDWLDAPAPHTPRRPGFHPRELALTTEQSGLFGASNGFYFIVWSRDGSLLEASDQAPADVPRPDRPNLDTQIRTRHREPFRESYHFTELGDGILVGRPLTDDQAMLHGLALRLGAAGLALLSLGLGGSWWLATRALRPIEEISTTAARISDGDLAQRIPVTRSGCELARLARILNSTFARLETAFLRQRQFTADASHELRTPLAVIITETQTSLRRERSASEYRETIQTCLHSAQEMRRLSDSLLELARFDSAEGSRHDHHPVALAKIANLCLEQIAPMATARSITIRSKLESATTQGDPDQLSRVVTNLLTNAVEYNQQAGEIRLSCGMEGPFAVVTVADTGVGIAAQDLPHLFERFYRADKARSRADGHFGLGLAICKAIVDAHGGTMAVTSQPGQGSTFTIRLPGANGSP